MSETSERVLVSNAEGRGGKSYWIREAMRLAGEVATLEAKLEATRNAITVAIVAIAGGEASDDTGRMLEIALVAAQKEGK